MKGMLSARTCLPKLQASKNQKSEYLTVYALSSIGGFLLQSFQKERGDANAKRN
jgi:hypothetical protein